MEDDVIDSAAMFFDVHPSVLFKLGTDLIQDDAQALAELAKNAFDADATQVQIDIDSKSFYDRRTGELLPDGRAVDPHAVQGRISVRDNGRGMNEAAIRDGWLTVSASYKRAMKAKGLTTKSGRTPLGDKGLGRLGVQRLGEVVHLRSTHRDEGDPAATEVETFIDWARFAEATQLRQVPIDVTVSQSNATDTGTVVSVLGLRDREAWSASQLAVLQGQVSRIISPYDDAGGVAFYLKVDGEVVELRRESRALLASAPVHVSFQYRDGRFDVETVVSPTVLQGLGANRTKYLALIAPDGGAAYLRWVIKNNETKAQRLNVQAGDGAHFARSTKEFTLTDSLSQRGGIAGEPGPFHGEVGSFNLDARQISDTPVGTSTFDSASERIQLARALNGVRVYRDGFGIRLDVDWLELGGGQTSGGSWFGLRPQNTAGYINLTALANGQLEETSSREAFRDTPAYRGFRSLLDYAFLHVADFLSLIRRDWPKYMREMEATDEARERSTPAELAEHVRERLEAPRPAVTEKKAFAAAFQGIERDVTAIVQAVEHSVFRDERTDDGIKAVQDSLEKAREKLRELFASLDDIETRYEGMAADVRLLETQLELADRQQESIWDMVALGMSAEVVSHEITNVSDRLRGRAVQTIRTLRNAGDADPKVLGFADSVRSSATEILRQVGRLDPMLRFRRDRKEAATVESFLDRSITYYRDRWAERGAMITVDVYRDAMLRFNPGKFAQIIDNLVLNAEYWTTRHLAAGEISRAELHFEIDFPLLKVWDNGPGVHPTVAGSLFEAFVTTKPRADGRGLGLYVVQQLLDSEGASIGLVKTLEDGARRDGFLIDFSGVARG